MINVSWKAVRLLGLVPVIAALVLAQHAEARVRSVTISGDAEVGLRLRAVVKPRGVARAAVPVAALRGRAAAIVRRGDRRRHPLLVRGRRRRRRSPSRRARDTGSCAAGIGSDARGAGPLRDPGRAGVPAAVPRRPGEGPPGAPRRAHHAPARLGAARCADPRALRRARHVRCAAARSGAGRIRALERYLPARTRVTIRVTKAGFIGKYVRITIRDGRAPARRDACLLPGRKRPRSCPSL